MRIKSGITPGGRPYKALRSGSEKITKVKVGGSKYAQKATTGGKSTKTQDFSNRAKNMGDPATVRKSVAKGPTKPLQSKGGSWPTDRGFKTNSKKGMK